MSTLLDQRVVDWAKWYHYNKDRYPGDVNMKKRCDFLEKAIDGLIECLAVATKDIQVLERRQPSVDLHRTAGGVLIPIEMMDRIT